MDPKRNDKLIREVEKALTIDRSILSSVCDWTKDPGVLEIKRGQLAGLIKEVRKTLGKEAHE